MQIYYLPEGLIFLGFQLIQVRRKSNQKWKIKIFPSKENQKKLLNKVRTILKYNKASSTYDVIQKLRVVIIGWANFYKFCECSKVFKKLSHSIFKQIWHWVVRRKRKSNMQKLKESYFPSGRKWTFDGTIHKDNWVLWGRKKLQNSSQNLAVIKNQTSSLLLKNSYEAYLPKLSWIKSIKYIKVQGTKSPYDGDNIYWNLRLAQFSYFKQICQILKLTTKTLESINKCVFRIMLP
eukprot:TRINITY_DN12836_c1_g1_i1.p1 TRINITY_DN12836_c1_g1~~TRINITY_DN12836_c1_g1_i1.p1  ORF type:complete len:235 (-),score=-0.24 TRINITY_DN12836_c1_g1_i1:151-855(-)